MQGGRRRGLPDRGSYRGHPDRSGRFLAYEVNHAAVWSDRLESSISRPGGAAITASRSVRPAPLIYHALRGHRDLWPPLDMAVVAAGGHPPGTRSRLASLGCHLRCARHLCRPSGPDIGRGTGIPSNRSNRPRKRPRRAYRTAVVFPPGRRLPVNMCGSSTPWPTCSRVNREAQDLVQGLLRVRRGLGLQARPLRVG